jgi:hypothetical protein
MGGLRIEFCGEWYVPDPESPFIVGRDGQLVVDDNPYLHRHFLRLIKQGDWWWVTNVGSQLAATLSEPLGAVLAFVSPGANMPLVFPHTVLRFTAGPTSYELNVMLDETPFEFMAHHLDSNLTTTEGNINLIGEQRLLVVALAEPMLRKAPGQVSVMPSSAEAARRLGWPITKFNRKLDAVCQKLEQAGIRGLHGGPDQLASNRRARLVEFAVAARLVSAEDLELLPAPPVQDA